MNLAKSLLLITLFSLPTACNAVPITKNSSVRDVAQAYPMDGVSKEADVWQKDPLLQKYARIKLREKSPVGTDGAIAQNQQDPNKVQVGWQRLAFEPVAFGVATNNRKAIRQGILAFKWAFERQSADGSFGVSQYAELVTFFGAYARSLLLLKQAGFTTEAQELARYLPQMQKTLSSPNFPLMEKRWEAREANSPVTNQLFWAAFCYHLIHLVQKQPRLEAKARSWIERGLQRQRADGSFPEKIGSDTHYQQVSLELLSLYSFYDSQGKTFIYPYLSKGFAWLSLKISDDGTIDVSSNTRTGGNQEKNPAGQFKQGRFGSPIPYIYWSYLGGGSKAREIAVRLAQAQKTRN